MLLYQRFEVPDAHDWAAQEFAAVWDRALGQVAVVYQGPMNPATRAEGMAHAERIYNEFLSKSPSRYSFELFTTPGRLWLVAPNEAEAAPLVGQLRAAGLLPTPKPPASAPAPPPAPRCARCGADASLTGGLCARCAPPKRKKSANTPIIIFSLVALAILIVLAVVFNSSGSLQRRQAKGPAPQVTFNSSATQVPEGGAITLNWSTTGATSVFIDQGIGDVELSGSRTIPMIGPKTFELTASGPGGSIRQRLTILVAEPEPVPNRPAIIEFAADRATVNQGEQVRLNWATSNATSVSLDPAVPNPALTDAATFTLDQAKTYTFTLTARGQGDPVTQSLSVHVLPGAPTAPTAILTVNGQDAVTINPGATIHLCWKTANADNVHFADGATRPANDCAADFAPQKSGKFTLVATGPGGESHPATVSVTVASAAPAAPAKLMQAAPSEPAEPTSGDVVWTGKIGLFSRHQANVFLQWNPAYHGGGWLPVVKSDGAFHGSIPYSKVTLSCTVDDGSQVAPIVLSGDSQTTPFHIRLVFKKDGDHQAVFHWEKAP